jgi:hypothetical protein
MVSESWILRLTTGMEKEFEDAAYYERLGCLDKSSYCFERALMYERVLARAVTGEELTYDDLR